MAPQEEKEKRERIILIVCLAVLIAVPLILILGSLASQSLYDNFILKYFWGPIASDSGIDVDAKAEYNIVNTLTYGFMVVSGLVATFIIFKKRFMFHNMEPDLWFVLSITPIIVAGAVFRALEDGEVFNRPFQYFFITPIIYGCLWAIALLLVSYTFQVLTLYKRRREGTCPLGTSKYLKPLARVPGFLFILPAFIIMDLFYCFIYFVMTDWYNFLPHPVIPILVSILFSATLYFLQRDQGKRLTFFNVNTFFTTFILLIGVAMIIQWPNNSEWLAHYESKAIWEGLNLIEFPIVIGFALLGTGVICIPAFLLRRTYPKLGVFAMGSNVLIFFGHFLDAAATYRAIDYHDYYEKHVLPEFFIDLFNTALVMFPIKAIIVIAFIWLVDIYFRKHLPEDKSEAFMWKMFLGIIKVIVLMVGLAPGLRDIFRLGMGI